MAATAGFPVRTHSRAQDGFWGGLGNAFIEAAEPPENRQAREALGSMSSLGVLIGIVLTVICVAVALFALVEGSIEGFVLAGIAAFLSFDATLFCNKMSQITQHPMNFVVLADGPNAGQARCGDFMRAAAEPTLLLKHIIALF
jgi:hypothetical protein